MAILSIETCLVEKDYCYIEAIVEDAVLAKAQTLIDPPEFGPALCCTSFDPNGEKIPSADDKKLIEFLDSRFVSWRPVPLPVFDDYEEDCVI